MNIFYDPTPALLVLWPLACALLVTPLGRRGESVRNGFVAFVTGTTLLGATALVPLVGAHHVVGARVPALLGSLNFAVDSYSMLFALFATFVWFAATLYSFDYLAHEHKRDRFHTASLVVLSAMLGVVLAADLVTLYLFFEILGLVAFLFVIHTETPEAKRAAMKYFWMTVLGGFALVAGIFLTYELGGQGLIVPLPLEEGRQTLQWVTFGLLVLGFGVKAGMLPVHVWLPDAHPVAPTPGSALLSGVMIKAGAYGIFRTATALFRPPVTEHAEEALWEATAQFGLVILWIGIATMAIGVIMALGQSNAKRMLAYHSVSQMGFILAGIGAAAYLGTEGALGVAGGLYHVVNHALFKGALFLGVGAVAYRTGELDMYKLGGLWKKMPLTFVLTLIAAAGITGVPLLNGFVSKCLIHHALVEAVEFQHLACLGIAEKIYIVTCGGTACSFIKLIGFVFLGKATCDYGPEVTDPPWRMITAMGLLGSAIIALGLWPALLIRGVFEPGLETWGLEAEALEHYLEVSFLSVPDLMSVAVAFAIGTLIFVVGVRTGLFHKHAPAWFGVNYWYMTAAGTLIPACVVVNQWYEGYLAALPRIFKPAFFGGIDAVVRAHDSYIAALSAAIRRGRVRLLTARARSEHRRRRLAAGLTTGVGEAPGERFIRDVALVLEREKQSSVRLAVDAARAWAHQHSAADQMQTTIVDAVRSIATELAERVRAERVAALRRFAAEEDINSLRDHFGAVMTKAHVYSEPIAPTSLHLAIRSLSGEDVSDQVASAGATIVRFEGFEDRLRHSAIPTRRRTIAEWRAQGVGIVELTTGTVIDIARILVEASTQEHAEWSSSRVDAATVIATRRRIQLYARDMSFNVAMVLVVFLVLLASIVVTFGR